LPPAHGAQSLPPTPGHPQPLSETEQPDRRDRQAALPGAKTTPATPAGGGHSAAENAIRLLAGLPLCGCGTMVRHTGRTSDPRRIRRLKSPHTIEVEADRDGAPVRLRLYGLWQDVKLVRRPWRIGQHWWRSDPVSRVYYRVAP